jgi:hypothetical protein
MKTNTLQQFSWNRVRVALIFFDKTEGRFLKDGTLVLPFLYHRHEIWIGLNGRGVLYNPWQEEDVEYSVLAPRDVQDMVIALYEKHLKSVQEKMELN